MEIILDHFKLLFKTRQVELTFNTGEKFAISCYLLRIHSPSAEMRGHNNKTPDISGISKNVNITAAEPVGYYALKLTFDDGHNTGLYTWEYLYELCVNLT